MTPTSTIFTLTAVRIAATPFMRITDTRCWGYYFEADDALEAVKQNVGGMDDMLYNYLVIEQVSEGIGATAQALWWFRYDNAFESWVPCECPLGDACPVNIGIG
jgi:hypothetical protein